MNYRRFLEIGAVLSLFISQCTVADQPLDDEIRLALDHVVSQMVAKPNVVNSVALVDSGKSHWTGAAGLADPTTRRPMTPQHQFRTASVAKTFTSIVVLQLIEEGKLRMEDRVDDLLHPQLRALEQTAGSLNMFNGAQHGTDLTLKHLLTHRSGVPDYFFSKSANGPQNGKSFIDVAFADFGGPKSREIINRQWEPIDLLKYFYDNKLGMDASFAPGQGFLYSDTNYLLLGLIAENASGTLLSSSVRKRILEPLSMEDTYYEWREPRKGNRLSHHFLLLDNVNHDIVAQNLASPAEWANGGMVTTVADLNRFIRGVFHGRLFKNRDTLEMLLDPRSGSTFTPPHPYFDNDPFRFNAYTFGLARWQVLDQYECWGHTGYWGIGMFYFPELDTSVICVDNQVSENINDFRDSLVQALADGGHLGFRKAEGTKR